MRDDSIGRCIAKWHSPTNTHTGIAPQPLPANGNGSIPTTATRFLWDGLRLIAELEPHLSRSYVYHPDQPYTPTPHAASAFTGRRVAHRRELDSPMLLD